jgi:SAM-dependent methyltransferase
MIQSAARRNPEPKTHCRFFLMDIADIGKYLPKNSFDMVVCLGNSMVHLDSIEKIETLIKAVHSILKTGGIFVFQLINYDMILSERLESLPTIETTRSSFVRKYSFTNDNKINFEASVVSSKGQTVFEESVSLYPLKSKELLNALNTSGFNNEILYSDFEKSPLEASSLAIVGTAVKA